MDHVAIKISEREVDRTHSDAAQINVLPDEEPMRLLLRDGEQHPAASARWVTNAFFLVLRLFGNIADRHCRHHAGDRFRREKLACLTVSNRSLKEVAEDVFHLTASLIGLHRGDGLREKFGDGIATASAWLPLRVLLHDRHVLLFHPPAGERAHGHVQEILERLPATHAATSCRFIQRFEKVGRFGIKELFLGHAAIKRGD